MIKKNIILGVLLVITPLLYGQDSAVYTGDNTLHLDITMPTYSYQYIFHNLQGRLDTNLEQFIFMVPAITEAVISGNSQAVESTMQQAFLNNMVATEEDGHAPVLITVSLPEEGIDLEDFKGQPLTLEGKLQMGNALFKSPVQFTGIYQKDALILDFSLSIQNEVEQKSGEKIQEMQLYAQGVRILTLTDE